MRVHVDETRGNDQAFRIDLAFGFPGGELAQGDNLVPPNRQIGVKPRIAGAIDDFAVLDEKIERWVPAFFGGQKAGEGDKEKERVNEGLPHHVLTFSFSVVPLFRAL
jgi:hypothetical protein